VARIHHADLWGLEKAKGNWLEDHDATDTPWQDIEPKAGFYLFIPRDEALEAVYSACATSRTSASWTSPPRSSSSSAS